MVAQPSYTFLWAFLEPMGKGIWLLMFGAPVAVAVALLLLEFPWGRLRASPTRGGRFWSNLWNRSHMNL